MIPLPTSTNAFSYLSNEIVTADTMTLFWNLIAIGFIIGVTLAFIFKITGWRLHI